MAAAESAEAASLDADVREINVPVNDVSDRVANPTAPQIVGHAEQPVETLALRAEKRFTVLRR